MNSLALLIVALALPTAIGYGVLAAIRFSRRAAESRRRPPPPEPADRLAARLRRLRAELEAAEGSHLGPAKQHHLRAVRGAYLDNLVAACARFSVTPPAGGDRARQAEVYRVEDALRQHGLDVRQPADI